MSCVKISHTLGFAALLSAVSSISNAGNPIFDPIPELVQFGDIHIKLEPVADGMVAPLAGIDAPGLPEFLFIVDQAGALWRIDLSDNSKIVFLDVSSLLVPLGIAGPGTYDERGFLGVAFHPAYASNGLIYTFTSEPADRPADFSTMGRGEIPDHQDVIREWHVPDPMNPDDRPDLRRVRTLFRNDHPQFNHDGGAMQFGPDGMLYIAIGDGGNADDQGPGHAPEGNGQNIETVLGKILRIDPSGNNSTNGQYGNPAGNPFVGKAPGLDEIFAYGFRNPFRMSFEKGGDQDLYVGDVGQNQIEEFNVVSAGENYGWPIKEGTFLFDNNGEQAGFVFADSPGAPRSLVDPLAQYDHGEGIAIIGGFVYEGERIPALSGTFVYGDFLSNLSSGQGRLFYSPQKGGSVLEFNLIGQKNLGMYLFGFGRDAKNELYVTGNTNLFPIGESGMVFRIVPMPGDLNTDGMVDGADLGLLLAAWNSPDVSADLNGDGTVDGADLGSLLSAWTS